MLITYNLIDCDVRKGGKQMPLIMLVRLDIKSLIDLSKAVDAVSGRSQ